MIECDKRRLSLLAKRPFSACQSLERAGNCVIDIGTNVPTSGANDLGVRIRHGDAVWHRPYNRQVVLAITEHTDLVPTYLQLIHEQLQAR